MDIELTWRINDKIFIRECALVQEESQLCDEYGELIPPDFFDSHKREGYVVFESDEGIFMIEAKNVVKIEVL